jgi:uncharacterized damage-inducible protein DinB
MEIENYPRIRQGVPVTKAAELQQEINQAHERFFAMLEGFDDTELETQPICGVWSARDVAGHLADWHLEMIESVRRLRTGEQPRQFIRDIDAFNHDQAALRGIQTWEDAAADLRDAWAAVIAALEDIEDHEFDRIGPLPWGTVEPLNSFFRRRILRHTRTHADDAESWRMRKLGIRDHSE